ncbi:dethiobiotin synthetase [Balnearium lithotrophicum]|uniref:ATP-dependent dethiobiotin synthetase BioD n=1 Tax=Balnearium lithotrophicum TaxID=223788 RepID=A0A521DBC9_9BACT|nr:dethiobiotin synthase [Balnearium lithotrophicum]SMO69019.1 dethiobiotin synthetase [Balnearium lithotrophicum]
MILITGTDTGVGKTYFTVSILRYLRERGKNVCGLKVVETGCNPLCEDAEKISRICNGKLPPIYKFKTPVAPAVASEIEGVKIDTYKLKEKLRKFSENYDEVFLEGAGGLLVPITWNYTFLDLARDLSAEVIVVALNKLGVINHTLLTVRVCECEGVNVKAVILNNREKYDESVETNYSSLKKLLNVPVYLFSSYEDLSNFGEEIVD